LGVGVLLQQMGLAENGRCVKTQVSPLTLPLPSRGEGWGNVESTVL
jgi:hypothetical protein